MAKITSSKWDYILKNGGNLRAAIRSEDPYAVIRELRKCYDELLDQGKIDEYDYESWTDQLDETLDDMEYEDDEYEVLEMAEYELGEFWDLCDNIRVWVDTKDY